MQILLLLFMVITGVETNGFVKSGEKFLIQDLRTVTLCEQMTPNTLLV